MRLMEHRCTQSKSTTTTREAVVCHTSAPFADFLSDEYRRRSGRRCSSGRRRSQRLHHGPRLTALDFTFHFFQRLGAELTILPFPSIQVPIAFPHSPCHCSGTIHALSSKLSYKVGAYFDCITIGTNVPVSQYFWRFVPTLNCITKKQIYCHQMCFEQKNAQICAENSAPDPGGAYNVSSRSHSHIKGPTSEKRGSGAYV